MLIKETMKTRLIAAFSPQRLEVINQSHLHKGHLHGPTEENAETHFLIKITSEKFKGLSRLEQQRIVLNELKDLMPSPVHALSLQVSVE